MIDPKFTEKIHSWLQGNHETTEDIEAGAMLLLQLNRDRSLYQRILRNPKREVKFLEYKLRRFLKMRQDGRTVKDVVKMDSETMPEVSAAVASDTYASDIGKLPVMEPAEGNGDTGRFLRKGIRPDHDKLPEKIQALWTKNAERWKKIKEWYETLKNLTEPCDRYEYLKVLKETWYKYKDDMARYDDYQLTDGSTPAAKEPLTPEQERELANADSYISKNLPKLQEDVWAAMQNGCSDAEAKKISARVMRLQQRVNILLKNGRTFTPERIEQLQSCSISISGNDEQAAK